MCEEVSRFDCLLGGVLQSAQDRANKPKHLPQQACAYMHLNQPACGDCNSDDNTGPSINLLPFCA